jgi:L-lactate dehydrogenase complex protein LldG
MSDARQEILDRIAVALADRPAVPPDAPAVQADRPGAGRDPAALLARFTERVADYRATIHVAADGAEVRERIADACARHGARRVAVPHGFAPALIPTGLDVFALEAGAAVPIAALDGVDGVLSTCALAIAETGTIVLDGGPGQGPRAATLLPDLHVCVVAADAIVPDVVDAIRRLGPSVAANRRAITLISGPSATSDIELDRVEGVHGPRRLEVIVARSTA